MSGRKLLARMALCGVSRKELAALIGVSENTIGLKINGRGAFKAGEIETIASALNISDPVEIVEIFLPGLSHKNGTPTRC